MSLQTFTPAAVFTKLLLLVIFFLPQQGQAEWKFDFSRRLPQTDNFVDREPASAEMKPEPSKFLKAISQPSPDQEMVILNTENGFVPSKLAMQAGKAYKIHVVNVNEDQKNLSFIVDSFREHHSTYFGKIKSLVLRPDKEGIYSFICPETAAQGQLVVYRGKTKMPSIRMPASE